MIIFLKWWRKYHTFRQLLNSVRNFLHRTTFRFGPELVLNWKKNGLKKRTRNRLLLIKWSLANEKKDDMVDEVETMVAVHPQVQLEDLAAAAVVVVL